MIGLPRQARDKHRERALKTARLVFAEVVQNFTVFDDSQVSKTKLKQKKKKESGRVTFVWTGPFCQAV